MKKIAVIVNFDKENALSVAKSLIEKLTGKAAPYALPQDAALLGIASAADDKELFSLCGTAVVLGGDGTIISAAKRCAPYETVLLGINLGHLGYLASIEPCRLDEAVQLLLSDDMHYDNRFMLRVSLENGETHHALNEIALSRGGSSRLMNFTALSEGKTVCKYRADGIIAATPTGSTAYSLAAGGPIIAPNADAMVLTPICPHMLRARSIVLPPKRIEITSDEASQLSVDGQIFRPVAPGERVTVEKSEYTVWLAHKPELSFYDILQKKF